MRDIKGMVKWFLDSGKSIGIVNATFSCEMEMHNLRRVLSEHISNNCLPLYACVKNKHIYLVNLDHQFDIEKVPVLFKL